MNHTTRRAYALYVLVAAFFAGAVFLTVTLYINGGTWAANRVNRHLYSGGQLVSAGSIYARDGEVLAKSSGNKREYSKSKALRTASLHTVGDTAGFIATGMHSVYRQELSGYSFINGVYLLKEYGRGSDIYLTIDSDASIAAYKALGSRKGTVGVYNYKTGEILCMVSTPAYDIADKPKDITENAEKYEGVYMNRFISGLYTPGSVMKVVTAAAAIENIPDIYSRSFECTGKLQTANGVVTCPSVHGKLNFEKAMNKSCNSVFAQVAIELGKDKLQLQADAMGLNASFKIGRATTAKGTFSLTGANNLDLGWASIGQYTTLTNPSSMITIMGAIANGGVGLSPFAVDRMVSPTKIVTQRGSTSVSTALNINPTTAQELKKMLRSNVKNAYGDSRFPGLEMCGKTGTAQVDGKEPHAWFVGFSQRADLPLAVVVVIENGGSGARNAIPIANKVLQTLA
ncbi:MAG TPA: penicillin-binding transpeptidase domain-containing protein [Clostridia bacterium]|nr:penicillin-binding transpeptidase domain-containing protein [Clostridia bacterium]